MKYLALIFDSCVTHIRGYVLLAALLACLCFSLPVAAQTPEEIARWVFDQTIIEFPETFSMVYYDEEDWTLFSITVIGNINAEAATNRDNFPNLQLIITSTSEDSTLTISSITFISADEVSTFGNAESVEVASIVAPSNSVTGIVTAISGWTSTTNTEASLEFSKTVA